MSSVPFTIQSNANSSVLTISGEYCRDEIYRFIRILTGVASIDRATPGSLTIACDSLTTFDDYLDIVGSMSASSTIHMIDSLSKQFNYLKARSLGYYALDTADIIVINRRQFVICGTSRLVAVENNMIVVDQLIEPSDFSPPELLNIQSIPGKFCYQASYYSFGLLVVFGMAATRLSGTDEAAVLRQLELPPFDKPKFHWFLTRCFAANPEKRTLLFI